MADELTRMAKPQAEEGFVMIALDLFVALMTCDIPNRNAIVLAEILSQSYGPAKRRNVHLDPATIEDITGLHRNNVRRAIAGLVDGNIIARNNDGTYRFLKDWERYSPAGKPFVDRLGGGLAVFARNVKARFGIMKPSKKDPIHLDSGKRLNPNPTGLSTSVRPQSNGIVPDVDMKGENNNANQDSETVSVPSLACVRVRAELDQKNLHQTHPEGGGEIVEENGQPSGPTIPPPVKNHPADVARVVTKCRELFELTGWDHMAKSACNEYPAAWVLEAIEAAAPARPSSWNYVAGVLRRFRENGGPDSARAPKANGWTPPARQPSPDWKPPNVND